MPKTAFITIFSAVTLASAITPALAADARNGERLALRWCASCHLVTTGQERASPDVPPFSAVARRPSFNAEKLAFFLLVPHPRMPDMALSRSEADDIAAYIATLRPKPLR